MHSILGGSLRGSTKSIAKLGYRVATQAQVQAEEALALMKAYQGTIDADLGQLKDTVTAEMDGKLDVFRDTINEEKKQEKDVERDQQLVDLQADLDLLEIQYYQQRNLLMGRMEKINKLRPRENESIFARFMPMLQNGTN